MIEGTTVDLVDLRAEPGPWTIGGKAMALQRLAVKGLPVPPGRVIPAEAGDHDVDRLAEEIAGLWPDTWLAVRSSGVGEDAAEASFAGQFETVLDVTATPASIASAVHRVRASAAADHVRTYGRGADIRMAVLVMPMVAADAAGIAFTRDPISGEALVVVEAVEGVGHRLAAGEVSGERWTVRSRPRQHADLGVLHADQAEAVAELARGVEELGGSPQDIEWAIEGERLWLLQARPITTLDDVQPIPIDSGIPPGPWEWDSTHSRAPVSPLLADVFPEGMKRGSKLLAREYGVPIDHLAIRAIDGYLYIQVVPAIGKPGSPSPPAAVSRLLFRVVPKLRRLEKTARRALTDRRHQAWHHRWRNERRPEIQRTLSDWVDLDLERLSSDELAGVFDQAVELARDTFAWNMVTDPAYLVPLYDLHSFVVEHLDRGIEDTIRLVAGASRSEYRDSVAALVDLVTPGVKALVKEGDSDVMARLDVVDPRFGEAFRRHQRIYGTTLLDFDFDHLTLGEDPTAELRRIVTTPSEEDDPSADALALANELSDRLPERLRGEFQTRLAGARETYWIREEGNAVFFSVLGALRLITLEVGRRLVTAGQVDQPDHAVFLRVDEITAWLGKAFEVSETVATRRGHRQWARYRRPPASYGEVVPPPEPDVLPPNVGRIMAIFELVMAHDMRPADIGDGTDGVAASAGVYTGPVPVVNHPDEFAKVKAGDVLVAPLTASSWEVLFPQIGALVTEGGGLLSHPAIVAREYRLPAVVGCEDATVRFQDGQLVTVDGNLGTITPVGD